MSRPDQVLHQVLSGNGRAAIAWGTQQLTAAQVPTPAVDAQLLAAFAAGLNASELAKALVLGRPLWQPVTGDASAAEPGAAESNGGARFVALISQRAQRIPLQHLTGAAPFRHMELQVGPGVFIPRPETEVVAQKAIDYALTRPAPATIVDLCTGSGAIALSLLSEVPRARVYAVELDRDAYGWAHKNIAAHITSDGREVQLVQGDARLALPHLNRTVDVVVSNPPYVPPGHVPVDQEVAQHDPEIALYGLGADGLEVPRGITMAAARLLKPGGLFIMEHAEVQAQAARDMINATGYFDPATSAQDLTGRDRMATAQRNLTVYQEGPPSE